MTTSETQEGKTAAMDAVQQLGTTQVPTIESNIFFLNVIGQIEGHMVLPPQNKTTKYEHVIPQLVAVEQNPKIEGLLVVLNTVGGDVEAGLAIAEMIASLSKPKVSLVLGGGAQHRRAYRRGGRLLVHCRDGHHDDPPRPLDRPRHRRAADV